MSEFVKKTIVGYKDVPGGSSDPDCTHVILTLNEYKKIVRERDEAIRTVGIERQNADRQMNEEKVNWMPCKARSIPIFCIIHWNPSRGWWKPRKMKQRFV